MASWYTKRRSAALFLALTVAGATSGLRALASGPQTVGVRRCPGGILVGNGLPCPRFEVENGILVEKAGTASLSKSGYRLLKSASGTTILRNGVPLITFSVHGKFLLIGVPAGENLVSVPLSSQH